MNSIDVKIMNALQENARISVSELSRRVNLSLSAVSERIKKLETSGVIKQYTTIINPIVMRKELSVLMMLRIEDADGEDEFLRVTNEEDEILECYHITGAYDYIIRVTTENTDSLEGLMARLKQVPGLRATQTIVLLSEKKHMYSVSPALPDLGM